MYPKPTIVVRLASLWALCALLQTCAPTGPARWRGYASIDSYPAASEVRLFWTTTTDPGCVDGPCPPPGPDIARVLLEQSTSGATGGWRIVTVRTSAGSDSMTVTGLENGRLYWFRVVALDVAGRQLLVSGPIMTVPGPPPIPSVSMPVQMEGRFSWSPGGDSIAFVDASASGQRSLAFVDLRTLAVTHLVDYSGEDWIGDAILSADGSAVAYTHTPTRMAGGIDYRVWTTELSPVAPTVQTPGRVDFDPAWGGGGWIYFCRGTPGPPNIPEIWRVRPGDTSSLQAITSDPSVYKYNPSVRRSDDLVVYEGRPRGARYLTAGLFTIRPGMGAAAVLTPPDAYWDTFPFWAPDGRQVVFVSTRSGHPEVWTVDVGSGALRQVTRGPRGANRLLGQWSPDRSLLAVLEGRWGSHGRLEIYEAPSLAP